MSENNTFKKLDFTDLRFSFSSKEGVFFSPTVLLWEKLLQNIKQMISDLIPKEFFFCDLYWRRIRRGEEPITEKRNFLDV